MKRKLSFFQLATMLGVTVIVIILLPTRNLLHTNAQTLSVTLPSIA